MFRDNLAPLYTPGPGTYGHDVECNRQACNKWPRMFDRPVARELRPELTPKALRTEMTDDQGRAIDISAYFSVVLYCQKLTNPA